MEEGLNLKVKVEEEWSSSSSSASSSSSPMPMELRLGQNNLNQAGPAPPFLMKTYEMVEDPSTDAVISWSLSKNSFIVWDYHKLSTTLLPRYFKHANFSSFIRQLNTYGFRKVDPDRWEFANEGFLRGHKYLLTTIRRRTNANANAARAGCCVDQGCSYLAGAGTEQELARLKRDRSLLTAEILKLKHQQHKSMQRIMAMEERIDSTAKKQQQMMSFLARAFKNPSFLQHYIHKYAMMRDMCIKVGHKRRLTMSPSPSVDNLEEVVTIDDEASSDVKSGAAENIWEELLSDDRAEEWLGGDEPADVEIEELTAQTPDQWDEDLQDLVHQMGFL
ncbi:heat shock factor protein HSF30-like [Andrographis paniculata]|uniref:heat shock factor protein HSF30-like n=1 Tax=Andrographis paniculata TaxID=175694 RepID=UPI0021E84F37|nr:heat shock factor protein HSF30-like [Andrographis paniculata]